MTISLPQGITLLNIYQLAKAFAIIGTMSIEFH